MKTILSFLLLLCNLYGLSQQQKLDSLLTVNRNYLKEDSLKVVYLTNIFRQYSRMNDIARMEDYAGKAIAVAKKLPQTFSLTYVYERLGLCYHGKLKYLQAIDAYNNGIAVAKKRNDKSDAAGFYLDLGALYGSIPDYNKSLEANQQAVALYNEMGDKEDISSCYMNIGELYNDLNNPVKAIEYIRKALALFNTFDTNVDYGIASAYQGIAYSYQIAADSDLVKMGIQPSEKMNASLSNLAKGLTVADTSADAVPLIGPIHTDMGDIYEKMGDHLHALQHYQVAYDISNKEDDADHKGRILLALGNFYKNSNDYIKAANYLHKSLEIGKEKGLLDIQKQALEKLSSLFEKTKQFDSAFIFYKQFIAVKDTIFNKEKEKEITRKQLQLDFAVKENDYKLIQEISDEKLKQQELQISFDKKVKLFLAVAILLALIIGGLIYYDRRKTKKLNAIINQQKIALEQLGHVKDKIFSVVSHDMRAPVNSLISFIDMLDDGKIAPEKLTLYAKELRQNLGYTSSLMNNLLNWAASQMQGFKPVHENFNLALLVTEVGNTLQHHAQQKQVIIKNDIATGTFINADKNMTAAILRNLMSNAVKYSYKGGVVQLLFENASGGYKIIVKDEGTGMDAQQVAQFNDSTAQTAISKRGTANEKGTGLGLLLCRTFAAQMNGKIDAASSGKGMRFTLWLPA